MDLKDTVKQGKRCMSKHVKNIKEIDKATKNWTSKVFVAEKTIPRRARSSSTRYQKLVLIDTEGTRVQASILNNDIELFEDTLKPLHYYHISNANVKVARPEYRIVDNLFEWTINEMTMIEDALSDPGITDPYSYNLVKFADLHCHLGSENPVNTMGVVIGIRDIKHIPTSHGSTQIQELILTDREMKPIMLTMWEKFVANECATIADIISSHPVIVALHLQVTRFNGLSLSTKPNSIFLINPEIEPAKELQSWVMENKVTLQNLDIENTSSSSNQVMAPHIDELIMINDIPNMPENENKFWIKGTVSVINLRQRFWYTACSQCHKSSDGECNHISICSHCHSSTKAIPRCRMEAEIHDCSGTLTATFFAECVERVLNCSAHQFMENTIDGHVRNLRKIATLSGKKEYMIQLKVTQSEYQGTTHFKYIVQSVCDMPSEESSSK